MALANDQTVDKNFYHPKLVLYEVFTINEY